ncbi:DUF1653 domain-containing protein [Chelatococcus reniformis]|nr:DUF1653 domain-containing protein [Chelatococcus reniformis]
MPDNKRTASGDWRHVKRGGLYDVVGLAQVQTTDELTDYEVVVVYRSKHDGELWVRRKSEFYDGRFEPLPAAPHPPEPVGYVTKTGLRNWMEGNHEPAQIILMRSGGELRAPIYTAPPDLAARLAETERERDAAEARVRGLEALIDTIAVSIKDDFPFMEIEIRSKVAALQPQAAGDGGSK